jgi:hypothetical protein
MFTINNTRLLQTGVGQAKDSWRVLCCFSDEVFVRSVVPVPLVLKVFYPLLKEGFLFFFPRFRAFFSRNSMSAG